MAAGNSQGKVVFGEQSALAPSPRLERARKSRGGEKCRTPGAGDVKTFKKVNAQANFANIQQKNEKKRREGNRKIALQAMSGTISNSYRTLKSLLALLTHSETPTRSESFRSTML